MPVYDCSFEQTIKEIWPSRVFDATGAELEWVVRCDTDTGEVVHLVHDTDGLSVVSPNGYLVFETKTYPAPLRLEKIEG